MSDAAVPVAVLIAGDAEADLGRIALTIESPSQVARGIAPACLALRTASYGVVVADVAVVDDALAIIRAAGRGRPAPRVVCLLPADFSASPEAQRQLSASAFTVRRHPLAPGVLDRVVRDAAADFLAEHEGWSGAAVARHQRGAVEDSLAEALRDLVWQLTGTSGDTAAVESVIDRCVEAVSAAAHDRDGGQALLVALAEALRQGAGVRASRLEEAA